MQARSSRQFKPNAGFCKLDCLLRKAFSSA
jgi:hypothetical protein